MKYLVPLGAIGVLYVASGNDNATTMSPFVTVAAALMVLVTLVLAVGGNKTDGR